AWSEQPPPHSGGCTPESRVTTIPREEDLVLHTESHRAAPAAGGIPHSDPPTRIVVRFCERLRHLPLGVWADASERLAELEGATSAARRRLRATVDRVPGAVARV